jgi:predicted permease
MANRLKLPATASSAFVLAVLFANSGNYGISVNEYAFGQQGLALAVICYVTDNMLANSIGIYIAARGRASARQAVLTMFRNPALYAVILGLAAHQFGWQIPLPIWRGAESLSRAAVPTMLTVLGMQLATLPPARDHWRAVGAASFMRLVLAPMLSFALVIPLGLTGLARQVAIVETAVPTAVLTNIIASQYETEPGLVASITLVTSLASLATITALLTWIL